MTEQYHPGVGSSETALLYDPNDNPMPIFNLLELELAIRSKGNVSVFVEDIDDIAALEDVIKILMMYNREVSTVKFVVDKYDISDKVRAKIQGKIDMWVTLVCPKRSRLMVTPYEIDIMSHGRRKRSVELGAKRNEKMKQMRNWELDWLDKN